MRLLRLQSIDSVERSELANDQRQIWQLDAAQRRRSWTVEENTDGTVLHLTNIHGDVALQLPLDPAEAPLVLDNDEYGNPRAGQPAVRYNWLGGKQRSSETLTGLTLMGVRLYNPATGRFLSVDPVYGGNLNAYEYSHADPLNRFDLDGKKSWWKKQWNRFTKTRVGNWAYRNRNKIARYAGLVALGVCVVASAGANAVLLSTSSPSASATRWAT